MFPPGEVLAAEMLFYKLGGIGGIIDELLASFGHVVTSEVAHTPGMLQYVRTPVPGGGVTLSLHRRGAWLLVAPPEDGAASPRFTAWPLELDGGEIACVATEFVLACLEGRALSSPYRWGRTQTSPITDLADALLRLGVPSSFVHLPAQRLVDTVDLSVLRWPERPNTLVLSGNLTQEEIEVTCRPRIGWTADYGDFDRGSRGRLSLRQALLQLDDGRPDVPEQLVSVEELAAVLAWNVEIDISDPAIDEEMRRVPVPPALQRSLHRLTPTPRFGIWAWEFDVEDHDYLASWAERWLRWCGFTRARAVGTGRQARIEDPWLEITLHAAKSQVGLGAVQRAHAKAALTGRRAVVISRTSASGPALKWSDQAGVLLIQADSHEPRALNAIAADYLPAVDLLPMLCDIDSCRDFGCCADDDNQCPDDVGKGWERLYGD